MARPRTLGSVKQIKPLIDEFLKLPMPTLAGLSRVLGIHPDTLYRNIDRDDEVGDLLMDAYLYMVQKHEERLYDRSCTGSIFWLRCLKKHMTFNDNHPPEAQETNAVVTLKVIDKE